MRVKTRTFFSTQKSKSDKKIVCNKNKINTLHTFRKILKKDYDKTNNRQFATLNYQK